MSDQNSSLPVRTEAAGDVIVKVGDATTPSQQLAIDASGRTTTKLQDGAGNAITSQANGAQRALDVGINVAGVQVDPRDVRALTDSDVVTANQGAASNAAGGWFVRPTDGTNSQAYTTGGEAKVEVTVALPAGTNNIGEVSIHDSAGLAFSETNPLPVYMTEDPGTERLEFQQSSAIAAAATATHTASAAAGGTKWFGVHGAASGKCKFEIYYGTTGSEVLKCVLFNSTANPNVEFKLDKPILLATGNSVKVIKTNLDNQAQDLYDTVVMINV